MDSDAANKLLAWMLAGGGVLLAYSAVKNRAPWDVLRDINGSPIQANTTGTGTGTATGTEGNYPTVTARIQAIANREILPTLVPIKPSGQLDKDPAASLSRIQKILGYDIPNTSAYRSYADQANAYYNNNETLSDGGQRYGDPDKSLHVVGLAIDIHSDYASKPTVVATFTAEGWVRARPGVEPWHYSYLVRG